MALKQVVSFAFVGSIALTLLLLSEWDLSISISAFFSRDKLIIFSVIDSPDLIFEAFHGYILPTRISIEFYTNKGL